MNVAEFLQDRLDTLSTECEGWAMFASCGENSETLAGFAKAARMILNRETSQRYKEFDTNDYAVLPWTFEDIGSDGSIRLFTEDAFFVAEGEEAEKLMMEYTKPATDTPILRELAYVFSDHPDWKEEWRP